MMSEEKEKNRFIYTDEEFEEIQKRFDSHIKNGFLDKEDVEEILIHFTKKLTKYYSNITEAIQDKSMTIKDDFTDKNLPVERTIELIQRDQRLFEMHLKKLRKL